MDDMFTLARQQFLSVRASIDRVHEDAIAEDANLDSYTLYVRTVWRCIAAESQRRNLPIYVFGAGAHSDWLLSIIHDLATARLCCVLDDNPTRGELHGIPVLSTSDTAIKDECIVLISSDAHEEALYASARRRFGNGARIVRLYEGLPAGPYSRQDSPVCVARRIEATRLARDRWGGSDFVGPYERAGYVTGFLQEQWLWSRREGIRGRVLDMSTPQAWHEWIYALPAVERVSISDLDRDTVTKLGAASPVDIQGDFCAETSPAPPDSFDTVLCLSILEHCGDPTRLISNLRQVLTPEGTLLLIVPFVCPDGHCRPDFWRFGQEGLRLLAVRAEFQTIETGGLGDVGDAISDVLGFDTAANDDHNGIPLLTWLSAGKASI